jgi:hypothetical protein
MSIYSSDMIYYIIITLPLLFFFSRLLLSNFLIPYFKKKSFYHQVKKRADWPMLEKTENTLKKLFKNNRAKIASLAYRKLRFIKDREFIYGEVNFLSFHHIIEKAKPQPQEIFYDLGSGTGKAVFTAALFFDFSKSCGVELLPPLYTKSNQTLDKATLMFEKITSDVETKYFEKVATIQFINDSFLDYDFSDASIIYVAATCFSEPIWKSLVDKMADLKPGSRIIVATKNIQHECFELIYKGVELMSWGLCPVTIYEIKK